MLGEAKRACLHTVSGGSGNLKLMKLMNGCAPVKHRMLKVTLLMNGVNANEC